MGLYFSFPLTILIEIGLPFGLAFWAIRRFHTSWKLVGIGGMIYLAAQMVHIPLIDSITWLFSNNILAMPSGTLLIVLNGVIGGLAAAVCEETARLVGFKLLKKKAQNTGGAFSLGIGHAGLESIIVSGLPVLGTFISMIAFKYANPQDSSMTQETITQLTNLWQMPWLTPLASALERLVGMVTQITLAFMILQVFVRKSYWFFAGAVLWHAFVNGMVTGLAGTSISGGALLGVEVVLGAISAAILWRLLSNPRAANPGMTIEQMPA